jgi:hypothetical protein
VGNPIVRIAGADVTSFSTGTIDQAGNGYLLLPNFGAKSRSRSKWIDTGFAFLGSLGTVAYPWTFTGPNNSTNAAEYPLDASGFVRLGGSGAVFLPPAIPGTTATIPTASVTANGATIPGSIAENPATLVRYGFNPNTGQGANPQVFTIVSAVFDGTNTLVQTDPAEGAMTTVLGGGGSTTVEVRPRFFRVGTGSAADQIPAGQSVRILFEGAEQVTPAVVGLVGPTPDLSALAAPAGSPQKRFLRFTVDFDLGASGLSITTPRPEVRFLKLPIRF